MCRLDDDVHLLVYGAKNTAIVQRDRDFTSVEHGKERVVGHSLSRIHVLAQKGNYDELVAIGKKTLLDHASDCYIDSTKNILAQTPLFFAAYNGHVRVVEWLLNLGPDLNLCSVYGRTALHNITWKLANKETTPEERENIFSVMALLLKAKPALATSKDCFGYTPQDYAKNNLEVSLRMRAMLDELRSSSDSRGASIDLCASDTGLVARSKLKQN